MALERNFPDALHGNGRFLFLRRDFAPAYLRRYEEGLLQETAATAVESLQVCTVCPRNCRLNRFEKKSAVCRVGRLARVASAFPHFGEEDTLRGHRGSGTIFFAGCNLRCVFCQNFQTSQIGEGEEVTAAELARLMLNLQSQGCHNINLVTPEHVVPHILEALVIAVQSGFRLPIVYNTSAYDSQESLHLMDGVVDIYMPDFKFWEPRNSLKYLLARDYPGVVRQAITRMNAQVGPLKADEDGIALRGLLVRHLVMPGLAEETHQIMQFLARNVSRDTYIHVMGQYHPEWKAKSQEKFAEINRLVTKYELQQAWQFARDAGLWRFDARMFNFYH